MIAESEILKGLRVLVVEDECLVAEEVAERLSRLGMHVQAAETGDQAIAAALATPPDLVLMDIRLKGRKDGIQAAAELRGSLDVPVVFLTAHSDRATVTRATGTDPHGYILKPFHERDLIVAAEVAVRRHAVERQARERAVTYGAALASLATGLVMTDDGGRITFMNADAQALSGWSLGDAEGVAVDRVLRLTFDAGGESSVHLSAHTLKAGEQVRFSGDPLYLWRRDGDAIPVNCAAGPLLNPLGLAFGAVLTFDDARHRLLMAEGQQHVQASAERDQKTAALERLARGVSRDFNDFLTVINGCSELAQRDEGLREQTRALIQQVLSAGGRATAVTRQLLAFAQGQLMTLQPIDLAAFLDELLPTLKSMLGTEFEVMVVARSVDVWVDADPDQLEYVLIDLVLNARDAMPGGGPLWLIVSDTAQFESASAATADDRLQRYGVVTVSDRGAGIAAEAKGHIFEPYFTTKDEGATAGLSLAAAQGIVRQLKGFIEIDSQPGRGTTVRVHLPAAARVQPPASSRLH